MNQESLIATSNYAQIMCGFLALIAFVPQWKTMFKSKSSNNISLSAWCLWSFCTLVTMIYSLIHFIFAGETFALLISTSFNVVFSAITLVFIIYYRRPRTLSLNVKIPDLIKAIEVQSVGLNNEAVLPLREIAASNSLENLDPLSETPSSPYPKN